MVTSVVHNRAVTPAEGLHEVQTLDFDQIQVQVQIRPLTEPGMRDFLASETERIRGLMHDLDASVPRKAVVLLHPSAELLPGAGVRKLQGEWIKANVEHLRLIVHAVGLVVPNPLWRGVFTALTWMLEGRMPVEVVAHPDLSSALDWGLQEVRRIGGSVSSELVSGRVDAIERRRAALVTAPHAVTDGSPFDAQATEQPSPNPAPSAADASRVEERLEKARALHERGVISDDELRRVSKQILDDL